MYVPAVSGVTSLGSANMFVAWIGGPAANTHGPVPLLGRRRLPVSRGWNPDPTTVVGGLRVRGCSAMDGRWRRPYVGIQRTSDRAVANEAEPYSSLVATRRCSPARVAPIVSLAAPSSTTVSRAPLNDASRRRAIRSARASVPAKRREGPHSTRAPRNLSRHARHGSGPSLAFVWARDGRDRGVSASGLPADGPWRRAGGTRRRDAGTSRSLAIARDAPRVSPPRADGSADAPNPSTSWEASSETTEAEHARSTRGGGGPERAPSKIANGYAARPLDRVGGCKPLERLPSARRRAREVSIGTN
jgi:hypothetical protein